MAGPFSTNKAAWAWLDRHTDAGLGDDHHRANVRALINRYGAVHIWARASARQLEEQESKRRADE
jgi:hypothetical protein